MIRTLAQSVPAKWRTAIYSTLATLVALNEVLDVVEGEWKSKVLSVLVVLGFGVAVGNVSSPMPPPPPPGGGVPEQFPGEFA